MRISLIIMCVTVFLVVNTYYDNKFTKLFHINKKYIQMATYAFVGLSLYLFVKRNPEGSKSMFKHANDIVKCINDKFITTGNEILKMAIQDMLEELAPNLFEENLERLVDFGHTFSATLEMHDISNLLHGEAVAIDICLSSSLSHIKGILRMDELNKIIKLINDSFLPTFHEKITPKLMWESIKEKKLHRDGFQRLPLPVVIGKATFVNDIKYDEVCMAIDLLKNLADKLDSAKKNH